MLMLLTKQCGKTALANFLSDTMETTGADYRPTQGVRWGKSNPGEIAVHGTLMGNLLWGFSIWLKFSSGVCKDPGVWVSTFGKWHQGKCLWSGAVGLCWRFQVSVPSFYLERLGGPKVNAFYPFVPVCFQYYPKITTLSSTQYRFDTHVLSSVLHYIWANFLQTPDHHTYTWAFLELFPRFVRFSMMSLIARRAQAILAPPFPRDINPIVKSLDLWIICCLVKVHTVAHPVNHVYLSFMQ